MTDSGKTLWDRIAEHGVFYATEIIARIPEKVLTSLVEFRLRRAIVWDEGVDFILHIMKVFHRNWTSFNPTVRRRFVENLFGHFMLRNREKWEEACERWGDYPTTMVISPTMKCNLKCTGCYSFNYQRRDAISTERLDRLYDECEELGIAFVVVSGGEPFIRPDTVELFARHPRLLFMTYTNGTQLTDRKLVTRLADLGNVIPCVSVEGFEEETDARRGKGVHRKIRLAMHEMRDAGLLFGFSATPMRHNNELLCSDRFVEYYLELGCRIGWYFSYMPVGRSPDLDLMPTPAQRLHRFHRVRSIRKNYEIVAADFWCDGALVGGCMSGARTYFHVNASGGVEPCVFHQFSKDNINEKSLRECLSSEYFRDVRCRLRQIVNPLRPCPVIDNPWILRELVAKHRPTPSQPGGDALLGGELAAGLDRYAAELKKVFDPVFEQIRHRAPWPLEPLGTMEEKRAVWDGLRMKQA